MRWQLLFQWAVPLAVAAVCSSCGRLDDPTNSSPVPESAVRQESTSDIIFRGRYFVAKMCLPGPKGELALGEWGICEVIEVLKGDLKLKYLKGVHVPAGAESGQICTFRWMISDADRKKAREAEAGGFTGMWVGVTLELVGPDKGVP